MAELVLTAVIGILGFLGVMYTIQENGRLARAQHERELSQERSAIRAALKAELESIKKIYDERCEDLSKDDPEQNSSLVPLETYDSIYHQLTHRLGLLTSSEMKQVIKAYALISELPARMTLLTLRMPQQQGPDGFVVIRYELAKKAARIHKLFSGEIAKALKELESPQPSDT